MTKLRITDEVCALFPDTTIAVVTARGLRGDRPWPGPAEELAELERRQARGDWTAPGEDDPRIAGWHEAYRRFGTNPRRQRPSVDALCRRLDRTGRLPRISSPVDCYNLVSVTEVLPAGAFDLGTLAGEVEVRLATGDEEFGPLGEPGVIEKPKPGEVIYLDAEGVLTRHWNHRDCERAKVTERSTEVVFLLETVRAEQSGLVVGAGERLADYVRQHAEQVVSRTLSPDNWAVPLAG